MLSCETRKLSSERIKIDSLKDDSEKMIQNHLNFGGVIKIDSISDYVMYPLSLSGDEESGSQNYDVSSYDAKKPYWNIIFYNTKTEESHLLYVGEKMMVNTYYLSLQPMINKNYQVEFHKKKDNNIYYDITMLDYNKDGYLDAKDPHYLFMSDNQGKNFKQLSPNNMNVVIWEAIEKTGKILIQARKDIDGDKLFKSTDEIIPFVLDLKTGKNIKEIFNHTFKKET